MNIRIHVLIAMTTCVVVSASIGQIMQKSEVDYMNLSIQLVELQKSDQDVKDIIEHFGRSSRDAINEQIVGDDKKLAFWINIYNGYILYVLKARAENYEDRRAFFKADIIDIAGEQLSFADIEHGILRRGQKELGLGYLSVWFPPKYQRVLRPDKRDYKIHFGLNCGAKSCPPVNIYHPETVHEQLCNMQKAYLDKVTKFDAKQNKVTTTPLMSWFRGDFGGKSGVKKILYAEGLIPSTKVDLEYGDYDWTLDINNFVD